MHRPTHAIFAITALAVGLAAMLPACSEAPQKTAAVQPFYVPSTLIVQVPDRHVPQDYRSSPLAFQVLAAANDEESYFPRGEKAIYGGYALEEFNAYSVLTYDVQRISSRRDGGYRYSWDVKQGINVP